MRRFARLAGAAVMAALLSGCGLAWMFEVPERPSPGQTPVSVPSPTPTPTPERPTSNPYTGELAKGADCVRLGSDELAELERVGLVGGAITYPRGARVKSTGGWWSVAVATQVNPNNSGYTSENVPAYAYFVTDSPSLGLADPGEDTALWALSHDAGEAAAKATACAKEIPVPKPKPSPGDPDTYTGKLAKGATCRPVGEAMLAHLEDVGQVGGAITYSQGQMVRANGTWWTVAVATQVNPNSAGHTSENVAKQAFFVTNDPSYKASSKARIVYFPLNPEKKDKAAAKAAHCLEEVG